MRFIALAVRKIKIPQKSLSDTWSSFRLPDTRKHRVSRVWSGLIQSHASPPCSGGQGHPSATSTCQRRLAGEGLWCDAGDRLKGWHKQRSGVPICQTVGDPPLLERRWMRSDRCHAHTLTHKSWHEQSRIRKEADAQTNALLLHVRCVI